MMTHLRAPREQRAHALHYRLWMTLAGCRAARVRVRVRVARVAARARAPKSGLRKWSKAKCERAAGANLHTNDGLVTQLWRPPKSRVRRPSLVSILLAAPSAPPLPKWPSQSKERPASAGRKWTRRTRLVGRVAGVERVAASRRSRAKLHRRRPSRCEQIGEQRQRRLRTS